MRHPSVRIRRQSLPPPPKIPPPPSSSRMALRESPPPLPPPTTPSLLAGWHHRPRLPSTCCRRSNEFKWTFLFVCQKFPSGILFHRYFIVLYSRPASSWQSIYSPQAFDNLTALWCVSINNRSWNRQNHVDGCPIHLWVAGFITIHFSLEYIPPLQRSPINNKMQTYIFWVRSTRERVFLFCWQTATF
jgi:hypothetical protein